MTEPKHDMPQDEVILRIAARGDGVTESGRYAALAAPGDILRADGSIELGPDHAVPPCVHFPECGGCQLQHLTENAYGDYVRDRVVGALAAQGVEAGKVAMAHVSPPRSRRRAMLTAIKTAGGVVIGFHRAGTKQVVDMRECHILHPALFDLVAPLRGLLRNLPVKGGIATISLVLADQGVDVLIEGVDMPDLPAIERVGDFARANTLARLSIDRGDGAETQWEPEPATVTFGGIAVALPHRAFLQATIDGERVLLDEVAATVGEAKMVADLFAGLGTFALPLSHYAKVYAGEASRDATMALKSAANARQRPVFVEHRDLYRRPLTTKEASRFDAVVLDPPRAGAQEQVKELADSEAPSIAYVSCNPSSFARDAAVLIDGGYRLEHVKPVGQFRWSTHIELIGRFVR